MNENERDKWDDAIRSRLKDFEADTTPADWEAIADRLPGKAPVPLRRTRRYWTVAAAIAALSLLSGGIYFYERSDSRACLDSRRANGGRGQDRGRVRPSARGANPLAGYRRRAGREGNKRSESSPGVGSGVARRKPGQGRNHAGHRSRGRAGYVARCRESASGRGVARLGGPEGERRHAGSCADNGGRSGIVR